MRYYHLFILENDVRKIAALFRRLVDLQREGKVNILGVLVATDNKNRLNGLSKNVVALKIERAQLKRQLVIDLE